MISYSSPSRLSRIYCFYSGDISIEEFSNALSQSAVLRNVADKLDENQIIGLKENHDMLLLAFKYLDVDRSGAIDREEFQRGVDLLNSKMSSSGGRLVEDPEELFDLMDIDGDGEIGKLIDEGCTYSTFCI